MAGVGSFGAVAIRSARWRVSRASNARFTSSIQRLNRFGQDSLGGDGNVDGKVDGKTATPGR